MADGAFDHRRKFSTRHFTARDISFPPDFTSKTVLLAANHPFIVIASRLSEEFMVEVGKQRGQLGRVRQPDRYGGEYQGLMFLFFSFFFFCCPWIGIAYHGVKAQKDWIMSARTGGGSERSFLLRFAAAVIERPDFT